MNISRPSPVRFLHWCIATLIFACSSAFANSPGTLDPELRDALYESLRKQGSSEELTRPFSMVIRGGISLGVYEAGVNWALLRVLKDLREDRTSSSRIEPDLYAAAGASAGAINGFLAGLFWCSESRMAGKPVDTLDSNLFHDSWHSIDINQLIDHTNDTDAEDNAAFSRAIVRDIEKAVLDEIENRTFREGCEVAFGLSLTRSKPVLQSNAGVDIAQQRLVLPMIMSGTREGRLRLNNFEMPPPSFCTSDRHTLANRPFLSSVIYLDSGESDDVLASELAPEEVFDAIKGSSSFPIAFAPKKLSYCLFASESLRIKGPDRKRQQASMAIDERCPDGYRRLSSFFVDGGVFDNDPLELVRQLSERQHENIGAKTKAIQYIKVDPGKRRPASGLFQFVVPEYGEAGDSLEITLWSGSDSHSPGEVNNQNVKVRHCSANPDKETWRYSNDYDITLTETSINSRLFVGTVHTSPTKGTKSQYLSKADIRVTARDRLLVYAPEEGFEPSCDPTAQSELQAKIRKRTIGILEKTPPGLSTQLGFVAGAVSSARGYRLYDELMRNNWHDGTYQKGGADSRPLFQPARLTRLVGDFLGAFGAFIDERFRDFDYYAGVYDSVYGIAEVLCAARDGLASERNACRAKFAEKIYLHLCAPSDQIDKSAACRVGSPKANAVLFQLIVLEVCGIEEAKDIFSTDCTLNEWNWIETLLPKHIGEDWDDSSRELLLIGRTLQEAYDAVEDTDRDPFVRFVKNLSKHRSWIVQRDDSELFNRMLSRAEKPIATWYYPISQSVIPQLLTLEDQDKIIRDTIASESAGSRGLIKAGLAMGGLVSESIMEDPSGWMWDQTSVPEHTKRRWLASVSFSEVAVDSRNGGAAVYWNPGYRFSNAWGVDLRVGPYLRQRFDDETIEFSEATAFITRRFENPLLSSIGVGPTYTYTWGNSDFSKEDNLGASISVGLLADKLRVTYGVRSFSGDDFEGDDIYWHFGVNDLPGIFYWMCRGIDEAPDAISWICDAN